METVHRPTGKQTGWIYATFPLACIFMPLVSGQLADKYVNTENILGVAHLLGAVLMFIAVRKTSFKSLFVVMFLYSICYAATLPLANSIMFHHLAENNLDPGVHSKWIFIWAPVAWALIGYWLVPYRLALDFQDRRAGTRLPLSRCYPLGNNGRRMFLFTRYSTRWNRHSPDTPGYGNVQRR
jgi:MFS family permease